MKLKLPLFKKPSPLRNSSKQEGLVKNKVAQKGIEVRKNKLTQGTINFRIMAFVGGLSVIVTSLLSADLCFEVGDVFKGFLYLYTLLFGILICILEGSFVKIEALTNLRLGIIQSVPILKYLTGRGALYMFSGSLQLSHFVPMNMFSGLYLLGVGTLFVSIGISTKKRLSKLKKTLKDERLLKKYYSKFDKDGDGVMNHDEFGAFVAFVTGEDMDEDELEAAFGIMDPHDKGYVNYDELKLWWHGFKPEEDEENAISGFVLL